MMTRALITVLGLVALSGCFSPEKSVTESSTSKNTSKQDTTELAQTQTSEVEPVNSAVIDSDPVYARWADQKITESDIDQILQLQLYDLEWRKYELRRKTLAQEIEKQYTGTAKVGTLDVLIEPPMPPRIDAGMTDDQPAYGASNAPVTLSVFCSYPSTHCASMTQTYEQLLEVYHDQVKLVFFDFPQLYHFNSGNAARAARCANEGGRFWPYHKGLLAQFDQLKSNEVFIRMARQVNLDTNKFTQCLESEKYMDEVKENISRAEALGLSKVPVTLINGLFVNGPRSFDTLRFFIDKELTSLGVQPAYQLQQVQRDEGGGDIPMSTLPLRLEGVSYDEHPERSSAMIQLLEQDRSGYFKHDDEILPNIYLVMIQENSVILENNGQLERIILSGGTSIVADADAEQLSQEQANEMIKIRRKSLAEPEEIPTDLEYTYRGIVEAKGETPLSKTWLADQLVYRQNLIQHFEPAEHEVEGVKVMRLTNVQDNEFYQTLGLQERDVVLRVNDQWVHSNQNNLFEKLESEPEVSVVLMRKGLPVHLKYAIN